MAWTAPKTWQVDEVVTAAQLNTHVRDNLLAVVPVGVVLPYAGSVLPSGGLYLFCDGSEVSRSTYSDLFAAIGTSYGIGNGSTTFNLPDLRGRVPTGKGTHTDVDQLGDNEGTALADRTPSHHHTTTIQGNNSGGNNNTPFGYGDVGAGSNNHTYTSSGGTTLDKPPYLTLNYIIKSKMT